MVNVLKLRTVKYSFWKGKYQKFCEWSNQFCEGRQLNCLPLQNLLLSFALMVSSENKCIGVVFLFLVFKILGHLLYLLFFTRIGTNAKGGGIAWLRHFFKLKILLTARITNIEDFFINFPDLKSEVLLLEKHGKIWIECKSWSKSSKRIKGKGLETVTKMKVFLKPNSLVKISCKSDYEQESYWRLKV